MIIITHTIYHVILHYMIIKYEAMHSYQNQIIQMVQRSFKATILPSIYWWNLQSVF